ncbi:MAG: hypothetical protein LBT79_07305 [Elusimicrobiota bacterium]|jgi:hypothetical protein|nr:hypothetical protein [Elusimicrobiota bacterium]
MFEDNATKTFAIRFEYELFPVLTLEEQKRFKLDNALANINKAMDKLIMALI